MRSTSLAAPRVQQVVPQPRVHLAVEEGRVLVHAVTRRRFARRLVGRGHVLGAAFHPGGFAPLRGRSLRELTGTVRPAGEVLGRDDRPTAAAVLGTDDPRVMVAALEDYVRGCDPVDDPDAARVTELVAHAGRELDWAELAATLGFSDQAHLTRMFTEVVGTPPATYRRATVEGA